MIHDFNGKVKIIGYGLRDVNTKEWYYHDNFGWGFKENLQFILNSSEDFQPIFNHPLKAHGELKRRTLDVVPIMIAAEIQSYG